MKTIIRFLEPYEATPERLKLESIAMNILIYKGISDAGEKVQYMSKQKLSKIIELFRQEIAGPWEDHSRPTTGGGFSGKYKNKKWRAKKWQKRTYIKIII